MFSFGANGGRPLTRWVDAKGEPHRVDPKTSKVVISPMFNARARAAMFYIGKGGFVPRHPAAAHQLFLVVHGRGWVAGAGGERAPIQAGQAAFWEPGEMHEAGTDDGMRVVVVEGKGIDPAKTMREIRKS